MALSLSSLPSTITNLRSSPQASSSVNGIGVSIGRNGLNSMKYKSVSVSARQSNNYYETQKQNYSTRRQDNSSSYGGQSTKVFVNYSIYKGKGALTISPKAPEFSVLDSGAHKVSREGYVFFQFAPGTGNNQYDWSRKQTFTLSVGEIGSLISIDSKDSFELFHDPFVGRPEEGQIRKLFKVDPMPDGSGLFFSLNVYNKLINADESINLTVSTGEFTVIKSSLNYLIPYLLGWNSFTNSIGPDESFKSKSELEWGR